VLSARKAALRAQHVRPFASLEVRGEIDGAGLQGGFRSWSNGSDARYDENVGARLDTTISTQHGTYIIDENGNVRQLRGLLARRRRTEEFIENDGFVSQPQNDTFLGPVQLPDGRNAYAIEVKPPGGLAETVAIDAASSMIDRISYTDEDGTATEDFFAYRVFSGALIAGREIDSNGDHAYDLERTVQKIVVDRPVESSVFEIPANNVIQTDKPVTVPLQEHDGHYYVQVRIHDRPFTFLIDTGAQAVVLDSRTAAAVGVKPEGHLEVAGAQRTGGLGVGNLSGLQIGSATLPLRVVSVLDLSHVTGDFQADGVLGYPFFASAEVTFDAAGKTMTFGKPGSLHPSGSPMAIDVDRRLVEMNGAVNGADGRFVIDTGNSGELLLFRPFMRDHAGLIPAGERQFANSYGVGGSVQAVTAIVDELDLGPYRFFNRYANLMLADQGAFADRFDAGNVGIGVLRNLVVTFDESNAKMYATPSRNFDDGRRRARTETLTIPY
jgi:predicted aspartyl protease